ncbi:zinc transporter ZIP10-like [Anneissia japonica]|uniref:zinc transporter ZIP10-like n=1 Tax=Anneissia japonica TaxID=1529436 RepID=UPI0014255666|nr:zinc transporter ZIP10-like [Anneissia japonica]XP_033105710.1 zinc transporter ZIP10-like [Anneissia japonica]
MNLMGRISRMLHPTIVFCCCLQMALIITANAEQALQEHSHTEHIDHNDTSSIPLSHVYEEQSLKTIFSKYGKNGAMDYDAFKDFLKNLGLGEQVELHSEDSHDHDHAERSVSVEENKTVQSTQEIRINRCLPAHELYRSFSKNASNVITNDDILTICPVLLQQLDIQACKSEMESEEELPSNKHAWGYSFASVTFISLISITGILVVPCTKRYPVIYTNLISYLVALAIGALIGDALLHLLPHAYGVHGHKGHAEEDAIKASTVVLRGSVAVFGILFFFICEKLLHFRKEKEQESNVEKASHDSTDAAVAMRKQMTAVEPLISNRKPLMSGCSSFPQGNIKRSCLRGTHSDAHLIHIHNDTQVHQLFESSDIPMVKLECGEGTCETPCDDSTCPEAQCENQEECDGFIGKDVRVCNSDPENRVEMTEIIQEEEEKKSPGHGHSHKHSHGHSHDHNFSGGIATVAWMVVMGDGLHNFCDGIAIGAAFANSVTGGISTSIAIFCHEIPHELGDFAVMLRSGMSIKKALAYMGLSSVLAYIGMMLGVGIGRIEEANLWIFALTGGMFLYIALVDLLPELLESSNRHVCMVLLQSFGIMCGLGIMVLIGLYEETMQERL